MFCLVRATCFSFRGDNQEEQFPLAGVPSGERRHLGLGVMTCAPDIARHCADRCHNPDGEPSNLPSLAPRPPPLAGSGSVPEPALLLPEARTPLPLPPTPLQQPLLCPLKLFHLLLNFAP